ncbi:MAG: pyridoxal-phosphate dependent enzyme [Deltaproteobacteria bacterium]|nr:pyridoxal-phosphate dependent enzyme [Deltaproteobacteria bacterium]
MSASRALVTAQAKLSSLRRLGWVTSPSPLEVHSGCLDTVGLEHVLVKRDDRLAALCGGSKVRKLDVQLASPRFREAPGWHAIGGVGSGQLVALALAAAALGKALHAHCFWTPPNPIVLQNLAALASSNARLSYYSSRTALLAGAPRLFVARERRGWPIVRPGATSTLGMLGFVLAGFELAEQLRAEQRVLPDRLYLPLGTGGSAVGLGVGLALAGLDLPIVAVAVTEAALSNALRLASLRRTLARSLAVDPGAPIRVDRRFVGRGYGHSTRVSSDACERARALGIALDPAYGGKAFAALIADVRAGETKTPLFWHTGHGALAPPHPEWRERLPPALRDRLAATSRRRVDRRAFLVAGAAVAGLAVAARVVDFDAVSDWTGVTLGEQEARTILAASEAIIGAVTPGLAHRVDAYVSHLPPPARVEVHAMLALIEHAAPLGVISARRFSSLSPADRLRALERMMARGGLAFQAARGLRDLCLLGHYASEASWAALAYEGPWVREATPTLAQYERLRAAPNSEPPGARHDL